jgi:hypothetical protein
VRALVYAIDASDLDGLWSVLTDGIVAKLGNSDALQGFDDVTRYIADFTASCAAQHHFQSVYAVDINGDDAKALVYHVSHSLLEHAPSIVYTLVGRYQDALQHTEHGWRISAMLFELCWAERREYGAGSHAELGYAALHGATDDGMGQPTLMSRVRVLAA